MSERQPDFLHCCILDGRGGEETVDYAFVHGWTKDQGVLWVHMDVNDDASRRWLTDHSGLDSSVTDILLADETRPRSYATEKGLLVVLRGVNTSPGADPEDMVSIRLWIEPHRIITTRRRHLLSVQDMRDALDAGTGPRTSGEFLVALVEKIAVRIGDAVERIDEELDVVGRVN